MSNSLENFIRQSLGASPVSDSVETLIRQGDAVGRRLDDEAAQLVGRLCAELEQLSGENVRLASFVNQVADLSLWDHDDDEGGVYQECDEPDEGYADSHEALMNLIEQARALKGHGNADAQDNSSDLIIGQILHTAAAARASGQTVAIDHRLPTVSIFRGEDDEFFYQESQAVDLLKQAEQAIEKLGVKAVETVSREDYLLYSAQSW